MNRCIHLYIAVILVCSHSLGSPLAATPTKNEEPRLLPHYLAPVSIFSQPHPMVSIFRSTHDTYAAGEMVVQAWERELALLAKRGWTGKFRVFIEFGGPHIAMVTNLVVFRNHIDFHSEYHTPPVALLSKHKDAFKDTYKELLPDEKRRYRTALLQGRIEDQPAFFQPICRFLQEHRSRVSLQLATGNAEGWWRFHLADAYIAECFSSLRQGDHALAFEHFVLSLIELKKGIPAKDKQDTRRLERTHKQSSDIPTLGWVGELHDLSRFHTHDAVFRERTLSSGMLRPFDLLCKHIERIDLATFKLLYLCHVISDQLEDLLIQRHTPSWGRTIDQTLARALSLAIASRMDKQSIDWILQELQGTAPHNGSFSASLYKLLLQRQKATGALFVTREERIFFENPKKANRNSLSIPIPFEFPLDRSA